MSRSSRPIRVIFALLLAFAAVLPGQQPEPQDPIRKQAEKFHNDAMDAFDAGRLPQAREWAAESLRLHRQLGDKNAQTFNLRALALIADGLGDRQEAIRWYEEALALARERKDRASEANTLRDMGALFYNIDDNERALTYMQQALALQREIGRPFAITLFNIGEVRRFQGDAAASRVALDEALLLSRKMKDRKLEGDTISSLAMLELKAGDKDKALQLLQDALVIRAEVKQPRGEASTRLKLGIYHVTTGNAASAREEFRKSIAIFQQIQYRGGEAFARQNLAMLERREGNLTEAAAEMTRAIELAETLRTRLSDRDLKAVYAGYVQNRYEFLLDTQLRLGRTGEAFETSERARARSLLETLESAGIRTNNGAESGRPLKLAEIQTQVLDNDTVLLEYALGEERSFLFTVTSTGVEVRDLPGRASLEPRVRAAYEAFITPRPKPPEIDALRDALLGPELARYPGRRLLIVADGALQYLPFAALAPDRRIVVVPSASTIAAFRQERRATPQHHIAILADPVTSLGDPRIVKSATRGARDLARLPFSRMEFDAILAIAGKQDNLAATGFDARRELITKGTLSGYRIVHIAAHSLLRTDEAERSELVLSLFDATGQPVNGHVSLKDIYGLKLNADLVVLSACQTALGKEMKREGLIGLTRGFQFAGAPRVLASLWKVDDRATAELMKIFYRGLLAEHKAAADALLAAQQKLAASSRWKHPFYWAGFVLQGEWR